MLERLASDGEDVALIAADLRLPGMDGVAFLEQAQELHRDASRVSLLAMDQYHTRIPFTELATLQLATALGRILRTDHQPGQLGPSMLQDLLGDRRIKAFNDRFQLISKAQQAFSSGSLMQQLFGGLLGAGKVVLGAVFSGVTLLILTLYFLASLFLASLPTIKNVIYRLTPASSRARVRVLEDTIFAQISAFISGTFVVAMIAGILSFIFLLIVGLSDYGLALALLIAAFDIIPLIGATIGAIIVCIVAFVDSTAVGIAAVIFYVAYQLFENYVLQPRVFRGRSTFPARSP